MFCICADEPLYAEVLQLPQNHYLGICRTEVKRIEKHMMQLQFIGLLTAQPCENLNQQSEAQSRLPCTSVSFSFSTSKSIYIQNRRLYS